MNIYSKLFKTDSYNVHPNNEHRYVKALEYINSVYQEGYTIADISTGRGIFLTLLEHKFNNGIISFTDIENFTDSTLKFIQLDLNLLDSRNSFNYNFDIITVLDVLEHISPEEIENIIQFLSTICKFAFFTIANHSDVQDGIELHTIQKNNLYWNELLSTYFNINSFETYYDNRLYLYKLSSK